MRSAAPLLAALLCVSCGAHDGKPPPADASAGGFSLGSFTDGFDDHLPLPPYFASLLPLHGQEETRESPGLYDPSSDQYFSYGVFWWAEGSVDLTTEALRSDVATYYTGLCNSTSVTVTLGDPDGTATAPYSSRRTGAMSVGSCFNAAVPPATIEVSAAACPDHTAILILVSPQPASSQVWTDLHAIRDSFRCW
jgi:hypothetical protein